jgi:hypothetical protein
MIAAGAVFLLDVQGIINLNLISMPVMVLVFATLSAFFFMTYFVQGIHNWGWLFPACILAGIAATIGLDGTALGSVLNGTPILAGIALPFIVVFLLDAKRHWWALIPAWVMTAITFVVLFEQQMGDALIGAFVLFSIALPFSVVFLMNTQKNWWAVIPACVMGATALAVLLERYLDDNLMGAVILFGIAVPFLCIYLLDRTRRWALIPFAAMSVIGLIPLMVGIFNDDVLGFVIMFLFAAAFFVVYFWSKTNWWALIPAGVFTSIGLTVLLDTLHFPLFSMAASGFNNAGSAFLLTGFAATFGVLWLLRAQHPTEWAKYPAMGLLALAALTLMFGDSNQFMGPLLLIAAGVFILLLSALRKKKM